MSIFSFGNKDEIVSLVVDVGNSTVTSALVVFNESEVPRFIYLTTDTFNVEDKVDSNRLIESLISILNAQLTKISKEGFNNKYWKDKRKRIYGGIVSFSSPWFAMKTKYLSLSNEKDFIVSESFMSDVLLNEETIFKNELSSEKPDVFDVIEKNILHTKINGYEISDVIGKRTKNLSAFLTMSAMDSSLMHRILDVISKNAHIDTEKLLLKTFPIVSFSVIRDFFSPGGDFLICDISGDVTDITLVQDWIIKKTVSLPSGRNFILRQVSKNFDVTVEIAESMLHLFNFDKSDDSVNQKIHELLVSIESEWSIYLENALMELSPTITLPSNFYLMCESDVINIYLDFLKTPKTDTTSVFRKSLNAFPIDNETVSKFYKNDGVGRVNEFITFVALFYKKILYKK